MNERITYWQDLSDYDLETAEAMLISRRYLYVGFMCHQSIEKIFKALYVKLLVNNPPKIHSLSVIAQKAGFLDLINTNFKELINTLEPLNVEARYPSYKEKMLKSLNEQNCINLITQTKDLQSWIKTQL